MRYNAQAMDNGLTYTCTTASAEATKELGAGLAPFLAPDDVVALRGDLGAGKTQFVQGVARALGVTDAVVSPTFNLVLEYRGGRLPLFHFDWYRLEEASELEDIGYFDLIEGGGVSFIEWGERFPEELPAGYLEVSLTAGMDGTRTVAARAFGKRSRELLEQWVGAGAGSGTWSAEA